MSSKKRIVIIGAGFGGLSAAAYLSQAGHDVLVFEKTNQPGGRARVLKTKGYTFDMGPSWYLMPDVFEEFFADFNSKTSDFYQLKKLQPNYKVFNAGESFDVPKYPESRKIFAAKDPGSEVRLDEFMIEAKLAYQKVRADILGRPMQKTHHFLNKTALAFLGSANMYRSYHKRVEKVTKNAELQKILEFMSVFMGGSPFNIPAIYSLLGHIDLGIGVQYPMGGFGAVAKAFEAQARKNGARIFYNRPVQAIKTKNTKNKTKVIGVQVDNKFVAADVVIANADYRFVETKLLPKAARQYDENYWQERTLSPSALLLFIGVKKRLRGLQHHNLFFDTDWQNHFDDIFKHSGVNSKPLFYLCVPSRTDPSVAPKGHENLFVLAPMPAGKKLTQNQQQAIVNDIITRIETKTGQRFKDDIVCQEVRGSEYFVETFNAYKGNAFGLSHTLLQSGPLRPNMQSKKVKNLFYTGQYTNPGTGVPMVVLSGKVVASQATDLLKKQL